MIGVELIFSFQVIALIHSLNSNYTQTYSCFQAISILNANPIYINNSENNIDTVVQNTAFNL
jgi:hypothetical protein